MSFHFQFHLLADDHISLLVNNLGGTSVLELNIVAKDAIQWLGECIPWK